MQNEQHGRHAQGGALPKNSHPLAKLLPISQQEIDGKLTPTVNARELHAFLKVGRDFSTWLQERITEYCFIEGEDFVRFFPETGEKSKRGRPQKEYALALGMGKELAMVERNEEGRRARRYFIDCEELLTLVAPELQAMAASRWQGERELTKDYHGLMCQSLLMARTKAGKETKAIHYINELNMLNKLVLGMGSKAWLQAHNLTGEVRQHLNAYQLHQLAYLERSNATLLDVGMPFDERKEQLAAMLAIKVEREGKQ